MKPRELREYMQAFLPFFAVAAVILLGAGVYGAFFSSPADYQQGDTVRIMYVHVPAAWMALFIYMVMAGAGFVSLVFRYPADMIAVGVAPLGAMFTALALITGSLWGKPMWGAWWVWGDARLTSVLILFFQYIGYMALIKQFPDPARGRRMGNILVIAGIFNVVLIKYSVEWFNSLHQPASISTATRVIDPAIDPAFLWPLFTMMAGFMMFFFTLAIMNTESEFLKNTLYKRKLKEIHGT